MAEPYGTIAKYRNTLAIKKHNALIQPWASAMAVDIAAVFWATWKGIEERLPKGDEVIEAEKPRDSRDLKNKYSAIIRVEVKRHSAEMQRVVENYIYRVWLAGAVEQCRDLGCTGWFFSSLSKSSTSSESASTSDGTSLQESDIVFLGTFGSSWQIGVYRSDDGKTKYVAYDGYSYNKFSPSSGVGTPFKDGDIDKNANVTYSQGWDANKIKIKKQGGDGLPYKTAKAAFDANSSGPASKASAEKTAAKTATKTVSAKVKTKSVKADSSGWVSLPNLRAQTYAKKHAAEAVTNINDTTRKEIASIVSKGVASGASYNDIAKSIKTKFEEFAVPMPQKHIANRAVLVAVTELANAYCEGNNQVGQYLQDSGLQMMKAWQTLDDDRVSDGCNKNEQAGWILFKDKFPSGDIHPPRFPGCRCDYLIEMLDKDFLGKSINAFYSSPVKVEAPTKAQAKTAAKSGVKSATKTKSQASPAKAKSSTPARQATKSAKTSVPSWDTWDTKLESREINRLNFSQDKAFTSGDMKKFLSTGGDKYKKLSGLLKSNDMSYSGMSSSQKSALKKYTGNDYEKMNEYLRSNKTKSTGVKKTVENAISAIKEHGITTEPLIVNRGFNGTFWNSWSEGEVRQLPEFLSTSVRTGFYRDNNVHIYVPPNKGSGVYIDGKSMVQNEYEYLIAPNSKFKVHHIEKNASGGKDFWLELLVDEEE